MLIEDNNPLFYANKLFECLYWGCKAVGVNENYYCDKHAYCKKYLRKKSKS